MKKILSVYLTFLFTFLCITVPLTAYGAQPECLGKVYHVAQNFPNASDSNNGSEASPFLTVSKAAQVMKAGDTAIIHGGVYREWVRPAHSGISRHNMITYRAAQGEEVVIKGSEVWTTDWQITNYFKGSSEGLPVYQAELSADMFEGANFFALINLRTDRLRQFVEGSELVRGCIFVDGKPMRQLSDYVDFDKASADENVFWVAENGMTIYAMLAGGKSPSEHEIEVTTREQVFAPEKENINYIAVEGLTMMHAANSLPSPGPLRGLLGSNGGKYWSITDCDISYANSIGMEQGTWWSYLFGGGLMAGHRLSGNTVHDCDLSGLTDIKNIVRRNIMAFIFDIGFRCVEDIVAPDKLKDFSIPNYEIPEINGNNTNISANEVVLPEGNTFTLWEKDTTPTKTYHVAQKAANASNANDGSEASPFLTISKAAQVLMPGETVIVHEGVYREWVNPTRGGTAADKMIWYRAAEGEKVVIKGSDEWKPVFTRSEGGRNPLGLIWQTRLTGDMFSGANVFCLKGQRIDSQWGWLSGAELARGQIFLDGEPLYQVAEYSLLRSFGVTRNTFWVSSDGMTVHIRLKDGSNPNGRNFEITTREQVFAPKTKYLNFIGVSGFEMYHAANCIPIPYPQKGLLSANAGNHWIIEDCTVGYANTVGIDLGGQWWYYGKGESQGYHIVRRCVIRDVGVCGIAAWHNMTNPNMLIEDNYLYNCGTMNCVGHCESGAIKLHSPIDSVLRRNVIVNTWFGSSIWLDGETVNTRVTQNVCIGNRDGWGQIFLEAHDGPYLVDNNILYDVDEYRYSFNKESVTKISALYSHNAGKVIGVNNLMLDGVGSAVKIFDSNDVFKGDNRIYANIISGYETDEPVISLGDANNLSDYNLFTASRDKLKMYLNTEEKSLDWEQWNSVGMDRSSVSMPITFTIDKNNLTLTAVSDGELPSMPTVNEFKTGVIGSDGLNFDLMSNARADGEWLVGPLTNMPLNGTPVSIDPRCGK